MLLLVLRLNSRVGSGHAILPNLFGRELPPWDLKSLELGAEMLQITAGVEKSAQRHVSADTGETVKIREFHGNTPRLPASRRAEVHKPRKNQCPGAVR